MITVAVHAPRSLDFHDVARRPDAADHGILAPRLEHGQESQIPPSRPYHVKRLATTGSRPSRPLGAQQLALDDQVRGESRPVGAMLDPDRPWLLEHESL